MRVRFKKTGERRYGVFIARGDSPALEMNPAPGFEPLMPHDLLHFLVEQELDLRNGIFGQIADGGSAGTFHQTPSGKSHRRADSRLRKRTAKRGEKLLKRGSDDCAKSERATYVCLYDWFSHSADEKLRARAEEMRSNRDSIFSRMSVSKRRTFTEEKLRRIRDRMDGLSADWSALKVDESITLEW